MRRSSTRTLRKESTHPTTASGRWRIGNLVAVVFVRIHGLSHRTGAQHEWYMRYQIPSCKARVLVADSEYNLHDMKNYYLSMPNTDKQWLHVDQHKREEVSRLGWLVCMPFT